MLSNKLVSGSTYRGLNSSYLSGCYFVVAGNSWVLMTKLILSLIITRSCSSKTTDTHCAILIL